ncbi:MAG: DUF4136 domain-containing protein [Pseudomonadota bacterium]
MSITCSRIVIIFLLSSTLALSLAFGCAKTTASTTANTAANTPLQLKTEADIMITLGNHASGPDVQGFPLVFPLEVINLRVYRDVEEPLASFRTFDFDYTNKTNPLLEKELFNQLEKVLVARGLTRDRKNPQITISMYFFSGKREQYTPPTTVTSTEIKYVWSSGFVGWNAAGYSSAVPVTSSTTTPGYTTTSFYSNIRLNFLNHDKLVAKGKKLETPPMIWMGEADTEGLNSDIRTVAPVMFNELIGEFPDQSTKAPKRFVRLFRYGGLGLGFAPDNWRDIRFVEPGSVAAENGIKPGDELLEINGRGVETFVPYSLWYVPNSTNYRADDPYFQHVLSNHGDQDIDVVIKQAGTRKKVTLKMRPRAGDRYINVDQTGYPLTFQ